MYKIFAPNDWEKLASQGPLVSVIPVSSRGLVGNDRRQFVKRASVSFLDQLDRLHLHDDELATHVIAMGSTEGWGANRNMDGWTEATLKQTHPTFVSHGRHYESHHNKDAAKSYGDIRSSAYNDTMRRVELLVIGNLTKQAAKRNGGLVLPVEEAARIERGDDVPWSMSCRLPWDKCANCGNEAPSRAQYCTEETCVNKQTGRRMPGCKYGLGKLAADGFLQYVDNPNCTFTDISRVKRPAAREAYGWKAAYLLDRAKTAGHVVGGAELAELYDQENRVEFGLLSPEASSAQQHLARQLKVARQLTDIERQLLTAGPTDRDKALVTAFSDCGKIAAEHTSNPAALFTALAAAEILLSPSNFFAVLGREKASGAGGQFAALSADSLQLEERLQTTSWLPGPASTPSAAHRGLATKHASAALTDSAIRRRIEQVHLGFSSTNVDTQVKTASAANAADYGLYVVAALAAMPPVDSAKEDLRLRAAVLQNFVGV